MPAIKSPAEALFEIKCCGPRKLMFFSKEYSLFPHRVLDVSEAKNAGLKNKHTVTQWKEDLNRNEGIWVQVSFASLTSWVILASHFTLLGLL